MRRYFLYFAFPLLIFSLCYFPSAGYGQGTNPNIVNYTPQQYDGHRVNYCIVQDRDGKIYFGNTEVILQYDGKNWNKIHIGANIPVISMDIDSANRIFVGGYEEFGYLAIAQDGSLTYVSLSDSLTGEQKGFKEVFQILCTSEGVFFLTNNKIFQYNGNKINLFRARTKFKLLVELDDKLFVRQSNLGFFVYSNDSLILFPAGKKFAKIPVKFFNPINETQYLGITSKNIVLYNKSYDKSFLASQLGEFKWLNTGGIDGYLAQSRMMGGVKMQNGRLAVHTYNGGVLIFNKDLDGGDIYNQSTGLQDNRVYDSYVDGHNQLWLGLNNGISSIDYTSPFTFYDEPNGVSGVIKDIEESDGLLYIASDRGVVVSNFKIRSSDSLSDPGINETEDFSAVNGITDNTFDLLKFKKSVIAATYNALFEITNHKSQLITANRYFFTTAQCKWDNSVIFAGGRDHIGAFRKSVNGWEQLAYYEIPETEVISIAMEPSGKSNGYWNIWLGTLNEGVICITVDESLKKIKILRFNPSNNTGLPNSTTRSITHNNKIYFITIKGLYSFNSSKNKFLPANFFGEEFTGGNRGIHRATMIKDSTYMLFTADVEMGFLKFISGKAIWDPTIFKGLELKQINAIYVDPQGRSWFGGSEKKVIRYDPALAERSNTTYKTLLRKVIIGRDSIYFNGSFYTCKLYGQDCRKKKQTNEHLFNHVYATEQTQEFHTSIPYDLNSITFEIAAPFYKKSEKIRYKYWLRGFEYSWSPFIYESKISYPRLPEGEYTFYAKAINIYDEEGQATTFKFIIQPPWYRTTFAYVSYFFLFTMVLYTSIQISIARLKAAKKRLERMVKDRTLEIVEKNIMLEKQKEEIEYEKDKSENLLLNILPRVTAEELKLKGRATPHYYDNVTVLFTDFKGFTMVAEKMHPDDLIAELDICFNNFDKIIEEHHIEKIKTMGDAYMCAGGIPKKNITNPMDVVLAGLKIQKFMEEFKNERLKKNKPFWEIRIGIHSGPIVAGVVGSKKFAYDIWGDTVNTASRMESSGEPGRVNISGATYELVEEYFNCSYRGKVKAKNKGEIDMHFVDSIKPEFSLDENHYLPNKSFVSKLHTMSIESIGRAQSLDEMDFNFLEVQRYVKKRFKKELPKDLYYHDLDHTMDVCSVVEVIAREEGVDDANIILLKTAALLHDIGFLEQYKDHEKKGVKITQKILPGFGYTTLQIATIGGMIMATKIPHLPKNHLEEIICDADLDYLGRDDFEEISLKLKTEFQEHGIVNSDLDWEQLQLSFFKKHRYFTKYSIQNRNPSKLSAQKQIEQRMTALQPSS